MSTNILFIINLVSIVFLLLSVMFLNKQTSGLLKLLEIFGDTLETLVKSNELVNYIIKAQKEQICNLGKELGYVLVDVNWVKLEVKDTKKDGTKTRH